MQRMGWPRQVGEQREGATVAGEAHVAGGSEQHGQNRRDEVWRVTFRRTDGRTPAWEHYRRHKQGVLSHSMNTPLIA
jgi:hypothetical protein